MATVIFHTIYTFSYSAVTCNQSLVPKEGRKYLQMTMQLEFSVCFLKL